MAIGFMYDIFIAKSIDYEHIQEKLDKVFLNSTI